VTGDIVVEVYDKTWARIGFINAPDSLEAVWRLNEPSTATIVVPVTSSKAWLLTGEGHRVRIVARGLVWSGWLDKWTLDGLGADATVTAVFASYLTWLEQMLCWPITETIPGTLSEEYDSRSGPAETVFKGYLLTAVGRLGLPIKVAGDFGRGDDITTQLRMHTPADKLLPLMEDAGLRVTLEHLGGDHLTLDVQPISTYPRTLTADSGVLGLDTTLTETGPVASTVIVGGAGDGVDRLFREMTWDEVAEAWGRVGERFVDARDLAVNVDDPLMDTAEEVEAAMDTRATETLAESNAAVSVSAVLSETAWFRIQAGVLEVGDHVPLSINVPTGDPDHPIGVELTETITEVSLSWTRGAGVTVTPKLGALVDDPQGPLLTRVAQISRLMRIDRANT